MLIVKSEELAQQAKEVFKNFPKLRITTEGDRHLGAVVGSPAFRKKYVEEKVATWVEDLKLLSFYNLQHY